MNTVEKEAVLKTWTEMVRSVDVRNVIDVLIEQEVVSFEDVEYIRNGETKPEQSRRMLMIVVECLMPEVFDIFMCALNENYPYVVDNIHRKVAGIKRRNYGAQGRGHAVEQEFDIITNGLEDPYGYMAIRSHRAVEREESSSSSQASAAVHGVEHIPSTGAHGAQVGQEPSENSCTSLNQKRKTLVKQPDYNVSFDPSNSNDSMSRSKSLPVGKKTSSFVRTLKSVNELGGSVPTIPKQLSSYDSVDLSNEAAAALHPEVEPPVAENPPSNCRHVVLINPKCPTAAKHDFGFVLDSKSSDGFCRVGPVTQGDMASGWLEAGDLIISVNGDSMKGKKREKVKEAIGKTERQLALEVESWGVIRNHRIALTVVRSSVEESWGFTMISGRLRPRFNGDRAFYCTSVVGDTPVGRSRLMKVGDTLTGCEGASFDKLSQDDITKQLSKIKKFTLHIFRREFIRSKEGPNKP